MSGRADGFGIGACATMGALLSLLVSAHARTLLLVSGSIDERRRVLHVSTTGPRALRHRVVVQIIRLDDALAASRYIISVTYQQSRDMGDALLAGRLGVSAEAPRRVLSTKTKRSTMQALIRYLCMCVIAVVPLGLYVGVPLVCTSQCLCPPRRRCNCRLMCRCSCRCVLMCVRVYGCVYA